MVKNQRKQFQALSKQLANSGLLTKEQVSYFARVFKRIGDGEDANEVLGLKYSAGRSEVDELSRQDLALKFQLVMTYIEKDNGNELTVTQALEEVSKISQSNNSLRPVEYSSLKRRWYDKKYKHLKKLEVSPLDVDSPYTLNK